MKIVFQINAVLETLAGFLIIFNPDWLLSNPSPEIQGIAVAKLYGILAFSFGLISYILSKNFSYDLMYKQVSLVIISFHLVVGLYMYGLYSQSLSPHPAASVLHLVLAVIFLSLYLQNMQKFVPKDESAS